MPKLKQVIVELTNACNSACVFCPHRKSERAVTHMDMGLYESIIAQCARLQVATPNLPLGLCGIGEPFMHPQFGDALKIAEKYKVPVGVGSNGGMLADHIDTLLAYPPAQIVFSIDAVTAKTHKKMRPGVGFDSVITSVEQYIKRVSDEKLQPRDFYVQILVSKHNLGEVEPFIRYWLEKLARIKSGKVFVKPICPWPYPYANTLYPSPIPTIAQHLIDDPRVSVGSFDPPICFRDSCTLFDSFAQILSDGSYVPCCMPTADPWGVGNVADLDLEQLFTSKRMHQMRNTPKTELTFCKDCT